MGELTVFIFMGPAIVLGAYYVMALRFSAAAVWASLPIGFLVAGISVFEILSVLTRQ